MYGAAMTFIRKWQTARRDRQSRARLTRAQQVILTKLRQLGDTADVIASVLMAKGITGYRYKNGTCPVANYLRQELGDAPLVSPFSATVDGVHVELPPAVNVFIREFDSGQYPALITGPARTWR